MKKKNKGWKYWVSIIALWIWEWKIEGRMPEGVDKMMIVVAPHRKAFADVALGWFVQNVEPIPPRIVGIKGQAFTMLGGLLAKPLHRIGGIPIDRDRTLGSGIAKGGFIDLICNRVDEQEKIAVVITPEGTRKSEIIETDFGKLDRGHYFHKGFWVIAVRKKLLVVLAAYNYYDKTVVLSEGFYFTGDLDTDMDIVFKFYRKAVPWYWPNIDKTKFV
ncbi:MAG: hypothetical protein JWM20_108 [Patescibacteria group bacterium]|nr:hypothetical protein [Patescibacteria group bacterium]